LESFVAVTEELHFGRSAWWVHLTASPVSRAVKVLERDVGGALLLRECHHVELTPLGTEFLPLARLVIAERSC